MSDFSKNEDLTQTLQWAIERELQKPHYTEYGNSPKMMITCAEFITLASEVLDKRGYNVDYFKEQVKANFKND